MASLYGMPSVRKALLGEEQSSKTGTAKQYDEDVRALEVFAVQVVCHRIVRDWLGIRADVFCGHSLGEYAALVAAEGLTITAGARLLCQRLASIRSHTTPSPGLLLALESSRDEARAWADREPATVIAAINAPQQTVLSGPAEEIVRIREAATREGTRTTLLHTDRSHHHHPLLTAAYLHYSAAVRPVQTRPLISRVYTPVLRRTYVPDDDLSQSLALQMILPVDFDQAVRDLYQDGVRTFIECGLKDTLSTLIDATAPAARTVAPFRSLQTIRQLQGRHTEMHARTSTRRHTMSLDRDELIGGLKEIYARILEFPPESVTDDVDLEGELGVDSLQHRLALAEAAERWNVTLPQDVPAPSPLTPTTVADYLLGSS
ncbi:acyltransferase domain-containing protein [Streptomyces microflavus]|uniref:acyltransferase domain-containing protein n=1 Tax=Streptomyces microflavus TaxID=1919 RepID=UPI00379818DD